MLEPPRRILVIKAARFTLSGYTLEGWGIRAAAAKRYEDDVAPVLIQVLDTELRRAELPNRLADEIMGCLIAEFASLAH